MSQLDPTPLIICHGHGFFMRLGKFSRLAFARLASDFPVLSLHFFCQNTSQLGRPAALQVTFWVC